MHKLLQFAVALLAFFAWMWFGHWLDEQGYGTWELIVAAPFALMIVGVIIWRLATAGH